MLDNDFAIKIEGLGKQYKIGVMPRRDTLREQLTHLMTKGFRRNGNGNNGSNG